MSAITDAIDVLLADYWPTIQQRQAAYYAENGSYFQGLPTHTTPPVDGAQVQPDNIATTPGDQPVPWPAEDFPADGLPCSVRLDVYSGNGIAGYTLTAEVVISGELWQRAIDSGADDSRAYGWRVATPPDPEGP